MKEKKRNEIRDNQCYLLLLLNLNNLIGNSNLIDIIDPF